jgi:sugar lactone lactonase YvrE
VRRLEIGGSGVTAGPEIDISHLKGEVTSLAANEDASRIVIGVRDPDDGGLYAVGDGSVTRLVAVANPGPATFARTGHTLYAVDLNTKQVLSFSDPDSGGYEWLAFAGEENALADPNGIGVSRDGRNLYVTGGADRLLRVYDLAARALLGEIALNAAPNRLAELPGTNSVFLLVSREKSGQPIWILDARLAPTVYFVPAGE